MKNQAKRITFLCVIIALSTLFNLQADLLRGPYSPESQELVKLILDNNLPVPEKLKSVTAELRTVLKKESRLDLELIIESLKKIKNPVFIEALIQYILLKKQDSNTDVFSNNPYLHQNYIFFIAAIALIIDDVQLLKDVLKDTSLDAKNTLLALEISLAQKEYSHDTLERLKKHMKILLESGANLNARLKTTDQPVVNNNSPYELWVFLLEQGLDVNTVFDVTEKRTRLDDINVLLEIYDATMWPKEHGEAQKIRNALISKGAKTYAQLSK